MFKICEQTDWTEHLKICFVGPMGRSQGTLCNYESKAAPISRKLSTSLRASLDPHAPWKLLKPPSSPFDKAVNHFARLLHTPGHHLHNIESALNMNKENLWLMYLKEYK